MGRLTMQFSKNMDYPKELEQKFKQDKKTWDQIYELLMNPNADSKFEETTRRLRGSGSSLLSSSMEGSTQKYEMFLVNLEPS